VHDVFPYDRARRFVHRIPAATVATDPSSEVAPVEEPVDVRPVGAEIHDQGTLSGFSAGGSGSGD